LTINLVNLLALKNSWLCIQEKTRGLELQTNFQKGHSHAITDLEKFKKFVHEHADYTQDERHAIL